MKIIRILFLLILLPVIISAKGNDNSANPDFENLKINIENLKKSNTALANQNKILMNENHSFIDKLTAIEKDTAELTERNKYLLEENEKITTENKALAEEIFKLKTDLAKNEEILKNYEKNIVQISLNAKQAIQELEKLKKENKDLRNKLSNYENENKNRKIDLDYSKEENKFDSLDNTDVDNWKIILSKQQEITKLIEIEQSTHEATEKERKHYNLMNKIYNEAVKKVDIYNSIDKKYNYISNVKDILLKSPYPHIRNKIIGLIQPLYDELLKMKNKQDSEIDVLENEFSKEIELIEKIKKSDLPDTDKEKYFLSFQDKWKENVVNFKKKELKDKYFYSDTSVKKYKKIDPPPINSEGRTNVSVNLVYNQYELNPEYVNIRKKKSEEIIKYRFN